MYKVQEKHKKICENNFKMLVLPWVVLLVKTLRGLSASPYMTVSFRAQNKNGDCLEKFVNFDQRFRTKLLLWSKGISQIPD